jgi:hypothetical protein
MPVIPPDLANPALWKSFANDPGDIPLGEGGGDMYSVTGFQRRGIVVVGDRDQ